MSNKLSTAPYKGVRDFYPQEWMLHKWMFWKMAEVCERFGYEQYNASPLEASEIYEAKSGEEIIQNETYNLIDRGDRRVTLRPEMTPTVARMVAAQSRALPRPIRWYSIPNLFRYERPQRGRLREHFQLNVDIFGLEGIEADSEVIQVGAAIMKNLGASHDDFEIIINNRKIINALFAQYTHDEAVVYQLSKLIDKKKKLSEEAFISSVEELLGDATPRFITAIEKSDLEQATRFADTQDIEKTVEIIRSLQSCGITNVRFDFTLMRGFDYYTDVVFEFFDTHPDNSRSLFGGGRYDDLLDIFDMDKVPAVGFGMGDVTARDFLETHNLLPDLTSHTQVIVAPLTKVARPSAEQVATTLRNTGINTEIDYLYRKAEKTIKAAEKKLIPHVIFVGEDEMAARHFVVKNIVTGESSEPTSLNDLPALFVSKNE